MNTGIDLNREFSDQRAVDDLPPESRIYLILPIEKLNLKHSTVRAIKEKVNHIGGLVEMTKQEAEEAFGSAKTVEARDALLSKGLDFGMPIKWPLHPNKIREIQLEAREVVLARLRPDQRANLFRSLTELNLSEAHKNTLRSSGMRYVGRLVTKTEMDVLSRISNDRGFLNEIKTALSEVDLVLGMPFDWPNRPDQIQRLKNRFVVLSHHNSSLLQ